MRDGAERKGFEGGEMKGKNAILRELIRVVNALKSGKPLASTGEILDDRAALNEFRKLAAWSRAALKTPKVVK